MFPTSNGLNSLERATLEQRAEMGQELCAEGFTPRQVAAKNLCHPQERPNAGWVFKGFTASFALELFEIREMFELRSAMAFAKLPNDSPQWQKLAALREQHLSLLSDIEQRYHDFSDLDSRFHHLINSAAPNRFIEDFFDIITLIFHYHYQWNKRDERQRNQVAIKEHLTYMEALMSRNSSMVELACRAHLASAKETLMQSTSGKPLAH